MNRYHFAVLNVLDKLNKIVKNPKLALFYLQTYAISMLKKEAVDLYLVSYPKCGRTWLRIMLQKYLNYINYNSNLGSNKNIHYLSDGRKIKFEHDQGSWVPAPPSLSHLRFDHSKYFDKKIVFLTRDPRDIIVSSWYHLKYRESIYRNSLSSFIRDDLVGINKVIAFMNMWADSKEIPKEFCLLTYEELHKCPEKSFRKVLKLFNIPIHDKHITRAIEECSFKNMKKMEKNGSLREPWMKPGAKHSGNSMKIRKGKIGNYKEELSEEDIYYLDDTIRRDLHSLYSYDEDVN